MKSEKLNENLREAFKTKTMYFAYRKKNGNIRLSIGTTYMPNIPENMHPKGKIESSENVVKYYDLIYEGWRSFKPENLLWVESFGCVNDISKDDLEYLAQVALPY